jgi:hypothetical protein
MTYSFFHTPTPRPPLVATRNPSVCSFRSLRLHRAPLRSTFYGPHCVIHML